MNFLHLTVVAVVSKLITYICISGALVVLFVCIIVGPCCATIYVCLIRQLQIVVTDLRPTGLKLPLQWHQCKVFCNSLFKPEWDINRSLLGGGADDAPRSIELDKDGMYKWRCPPILEPWLHHWLTDHLIDFIFDNFQVIELLHYCYNAFLVFYRHLMMFVSFQHCNCSKVFASELCCVLFYFSIVTRNKQNHITKI